METVAFYSYKGGVGRTLLVANTAQFLAMSGRNVVALDLDLEAPGLHQKLGSREVMSRAAAGTLWGAVDELLDILEKEPSERKPISFEAVNLPLDTKGALRLIPAGAAPSHGYWAALERLNNVLRTRSRDRGELPEAVLELQARIQEELKPDFLLIDSRTGITELGGLATSLLANRVVCLTTTAPESVEGTKVVADALRKAPRLKSQEPIQLDFLITRVVSESTSSRITSLLKEQFGSSVTTLPHDSGIADEERVISGPRASQFDKAGQTDYDEREGLTLFSATLDWISQSFPGHEEDARKARRRLESVHHLWHWLTRHHPRRGIGRLPRSSPWPMEQLRERVSFKSRLADIVAYDSAAPDAKPLVIFEYIENEDRDDVANWWLNETGVPIVALFSKYYERIDYYSKSKEDSKRLHRRDPWATPLPLDFKVLSDPIDDSVEALLETVRRGHPEYLDRIVSNWDYSGAGSKPNSASQIVNILSSVDDIHLARTVLEAVSYSFENRKGRLHPWGFVSDDQMLSGLFAPLLWRLPAEATVTVLDRADDSGRIQEAHPYATAAVTLLTRDLFGLQYTPVSTFRMDGRHFTISFEISSEPPAMVATQRRVLDVSEFVTGQISARSLVITGLLGDYEPKVVRVVLYASAIAQCAEKLALQPRHVGSVVLIHETLHALMHLGRDLDGRMWPEFALPDPSSPLFEPSWIHEPLAQYFTYQHLRRLKDPALMRAFETMSAKSAAPYRAWERMKDLPIEDARNWLMSVRRGVGGAPASIQMVLNSMRDTT